jgi:hypothetical protein
MGSCVISWTPAERSGSESIAKWRMLTWDIKDIIIDCVDPERLAVFWGGLLGRPIAGSTGPYVWLKRESGLGGGFHRRSPSQEQARTGCTSTSRRR